MTNFASLPTEIAPLIMKHLDRKDLYTCTRINTQFSMAANPLLWRTIHLHHQARGIGFLYCLTMARPIVGQWIRSVHLENFYWSDKSLLLLMRRAPLLTSLVLDNAKRLTNKSMQHISQWSHLQSLHLGGLERLFIVPGGSEVRDPTAITIVTEGLHHLTHLKVSDATLVTPNPSCWPPHLTWLELDRMDDNVTATIALIRGLPDNLTHLALKNGKFTNIALDAIVTYKPRLIELDLSGNNHITPRSVRRLIRSTSHLTLVTVSCCAAMTIDDFPEATTMPSTLTKLHQLDQQAITKIRQRKDRFSDDQVRKGKMNTVTDHV